MRSQWHLQLSGSLRAPIGADWDNVEIGLVMSRGDLRAPDTLGGINLPGEDLGVCTTEGVGPCVWFCDIIFHIQFDQGKLRVFSHNLGILTRGYGLRTPRPAPNFLG